MLSAEDRFCVGGSVRLVGHRGAAGVAPENTVPGLRHAVRVGADAVEFDIHCTRDGEIVLFHDATLERTTDGRGPVADHSLADLRALDAGYRFTVDGGRRYPFRGRGVHIPTLDEAFASIRDLPAIIEVKTPAAGRALADWLRNRPERERVVVGGFSREFVHSAAEVARWRAATEEQLRPFVLFGKFGLGRRFAPAADALMVPEKHRGIRVVSRSFVASAHRQGLAVYVWTVNRPDDMRRLIDWGVDGLISDYPAILGRVFDEVAT